MSLRNQVPDKNLQRSVDQKLAQRGAGSQSRVTATVRSGAVTLTGTLHYEHERRAIVRSASSVSGVNRVIDNLTVAIKKKQ